MKCLATNTATSSSVLLLFTFKKYKDTVATMMDVVTSGGHIQDDVDALKDMLIHRLDGNTPALIDYGNKGLGHDLVSCFLHVIRMVFIDLKEAPSINAKAEEGYLKALRQSPG